MPRHVVVDGSNLATEGRSLPSLQQLVDAVQAFMEENPDDLITVVVDATFGHRIDPRELAEFDAAIEHNEIVAPPAGAVGRGDAFVLAIANKVHATIISNDSYQEFHGEHTWLFDEGRLVGGKPVPHVGWVFVPRVPVRGPLSRKVTREAKRRPAAKAPAGVGRPSREASLPLPVPSAPPPRVRLTASSDAPEGADIVVPADVPKAKPERRGRGRGRQAVEAAPADAAVAETPAAAAVPEGHASTRVPTPNKSSMVNELLPFLAFVEHHPVGSAVEAVVESYASHGAYVTIGDARGYIPLRLMAVPAPRSAREVMKLNETVTLHVAAFHGQRRGIDLATPAMAHLIEPMSADDTDDAEDAVPAAITEPAVPAKRGGRKRAATPASAEPAPSRPAAKAPAAKRAAPKKAAAAATEQPTTEQATTEQATTEQATTEQPTTRKAAAKRPAKKAAAAPVAVVPVPAAAEVAPEPAKAAPAKRAASKPAVAKPAVVEPAVVKPAVAKPAKKAVAKKAAAAEPVATAAPVKPTAGRRAPAKKTEPAPKIAAAAPEAPAKKAAAGTKAAAKKAPAKRVAMPSAAS